MGQRRAAVKEIAHTKRSLKLQRQLKLRCVKQVKEGADRSLVSLSLLLTAHRFEKEKCAQFARDLLN